MKVVQNIKGAARYVSEGFMRLFRPTDDSYPNVGIQPFEGSRSKKS